MKLPQLSLRDLFWLVLVCALAVGWWVNRRQLLLENASQRDLVKTWYERTDNVFKFYRKSGQWIEWHDDGTFQVLDP